MATGYDIRMGIPPNHLTAMADAARETNTIAVFRANKPAAIPLIGRGAVGKPKALSLPGFKTSPATGVLTATTEEQKALVLRNGLYLMSPDGVARNFGRTPREVRPPVVYWTVEAGQVVHESGHPVVGDYDLLGVIPLESPGRNLVPVPDDLAHGDWLGPDVRRFMEAVNRRLDRPRVLHGAQDQLGLRRYGGLTHDLAYAVFADAPAKLLDGHRAQRSFYDKHGRKSALGRYKSTGEPPPGGPGLRLAR